MKRRRRQKYQQTDWIPTLSDHQIGQQQFESNNNLTINSQDQLIRSKSWRKFFNFPKNITQIFAQQSYQTAQQDLIGYRQPVNAIKTTPNKSNSIMMQPDSYKMFKSQDKQYHQLSRLITRRKLLLVSLLSIVITSIILLQQPQYSNCQRQNGQQDRQPVNMVTANSLNDQLVNGNGNGNNLANNDQSSASANTLNQFVNLIMSSLSNQQQSNPNRRLLPTSGLSNNNNNNQQPNVPMLKPPVNTQMNPQNIGLNPMLSNNQMHASTPLPFPLRNGGLNNRMSQPSMGPALGNALGSGNGMFLASSPPPSSYLQLNRINQQLGSTTSQSNANRLQFPNQPTNTLPLGSMLSGPNNNRMQPPQLPSLVNSRPPTLNPNNNIRPNNVNRITRPSVASLPPSFVPVVPGANSAPPVKPIGGFAPSVAPPKLNVSSPTQAPAVLSTTTSDPQFGTSELGELNRTTLPSVTSEKPSYSSSSINDYSRDQYSEIPMGSSTTISLVSTGSSISVGSEPTSSSSESVSTSTGQSLEVNETSWNPVRNETVQELHKNKLNSSSLAPSPDIVTIPPGYNPDNPKIQPNTYDISVSAQMGAAPANPLKVALGPSDSLTTTTTTTTIASGVTPPIVAPTAVTTIFWSPPPSSAPSSVAKHSTMLSEGPQTITIDQTATQTQTPATSLPAITPTPNTSPKQTNGRPRDDAILVGQDHKSQSDESVSETKTTQNGVVYGKAPLGRDSNKPTPPAQIFNPSPTGSHSTIESSLPGRPFIQSVQVDNQVRPFAGPTKQQPVSLNSASSSSKSNSPFRASRPIGAESQAPSGVHVGSGFTISGNGNQTIPSGDIQDYISGQPPAFSSSNLNAAIDISEHSKGHSIEEPQTLTQNSVNPSTGVAGNSTTSRQEQPNSHFPAITSTQAPRPRRPVFKVKPDKPPIRIDSCIVGDDSSCEQSHNERCITEYGISSCHCKPGFARLSQLRGPCKPVEWFQVSLKIDKLSDDRRLVFNQTLINSNSEEYQLLEYESIQAISWAIQQTSMGKKFMGARVNKFFERESKIWANLSVSFDSGNTTIDDKSRAKLSQELAKLVQPAKGSKPIGDSMIVLDQATSQAQSAREGPISKLVDINECSQRDLNDCSSNATCTNDFGGFQCQCLPGYEDKYGSSGDRSKMGRVCLGCSPGYCSNRGVCSIVDGQKHCKCRPNFIGARCDIDSEVLMVALVGSLVGIIILIITFWCLFVFNRRWKREQQKMDAMSATSGLTYNYITSSNSNSLMSQARNLAPQSMPILGLQRSSNVNNNNNNNNSNSSHYAKRYNLSNGLQDSNQFGGGHDQQVIMGSTSSGSSAAIQPIGYNSAFAASQYDDAAGLLIAPTSSGSSEQTSPSDSYRPQQPTAHHAFNAYTLSGHHHHHHMNANAHHNHHYHHGHPSLTNLNHMSKSIGQLSQFQPADYRSLYAGNGAYDNRWNRSMQLDSNVDKNNAVVGYYLSPDMLMNQQQQQLYGHQRQLSIETSVNGPRPRRQIGRQGGNAGAMRSRSQGPVARNSSSGIYDHLDCDLDMYK